MLQYTVCKKNTYLRESTVLFSTIPCTLACLDLSLVILHSVLSTLVSSSRRVYISNIRFYSCAIHILNQLQPSGWLICSFILSWRTVQHALRSSVIIYVWNDKIFCKRKILQCCLAFHAFLFCEFAFGNKVGGWPKLRFCEEILKFRGHATWCSALVRHVWMSFNSPFPVKRYQGEVSMTNFMVVMGMVLLPHPCQLGPDPGC